MTDFKHFEYFDFSFTKGKFNIKLKKKFLKSKPLIKSGNIPYTSSNLEYFVYHLEDDKLAAVCYNFRKSFFNMEKCSKFFLENSLIEESQYKSYVDDLKSKKIKGLKTHKDSMKNPVTLERIRISNSRTAKGRGEIVKQKWASVEGREKYLLSLNNKDVIKKRIENFKITISKTKVSYLAAMREPARVERIRKAIIARNSQYTHEQKRKMFFACRKFGKTSIEVKMENLLKEFSVCYKYEKQISIGKKEYYPDFLLEDLHIVVECYGDYWHANPSKYKENDIITGKKCKEIWERDSQRKKDFEENGFEFVCFWETDFLNLENIKSTICQIIQKKKSALEILQKNTSI